MNKTVVLNSTFQVRSEAGFLDNPNIRRVSFIITDDKPNANNVGIKAAQFISLAASALYMPIKMAEGEIARGHLGATPLGVIIGTEIKELPDLAQIYGEGVLWVAERPADVAYFSSVTNLRGAYLSWEIAYTEEEVDENGVTWLLDPVLLAVTVVSDPAYGKRTPVISASINEVEMEENVNALTDTTQVEKDKSLDEGLLSELEELRAYKARIEEEKELQRRIAEIRDAIPEISEDDAKILSGISQPQLQVIKTLLSSKRVTSSKESVEVIPELPERDSDDPKKILIAYLSGLGGRNASK